MSVRIVFVGPARASLYHSILFRSHFSFFSARLGAWGYGAANFEAEQGAPSCVCLQRACFASCITVW